MENEMKLVGPFKQILTMRGLALKGALNDRLLEIVSDGGILIKGDKILQIGDFRGLASEFSSIAEIVYLKGDYIVTPGFVDCHTHIAFGGNRANDFAMRNAGSSYLEIAETGGGIWSTVKHTRECTQDQLSDLTFMRAQHLLSQGITTIEVKSGYGLTVEEELKTLRAISNANLRSDSDLISTCLAAHMLPKDFQGTAEEYLLEISEKLFPILKTESLTRRIDAFVEKSAFAAEQIRPFFQRAKDLGFDITVHADQFTTSGSALAVEFQARSADHLEASKEAEIQLLADSNVIAVALPAASLGLGCNFTPARKLLDAGGSLAIATDWNPGSAPIGQLVCSASILATMEKLSNTEAFAGITFRAAEALGLSDRGRLQSGFLADFNIYNTNNYQNITYLQGGLNPVEVWKNGIRVFNK